MSVSTCVHASLIWSSVKNRTQLLATVSFNIRPIKVLTSGPETLMPPISRYIRRVGNFCLNLRNEVVYAIPSEPCEACRRRGYLCAYEPRLLEELASMKACMGCRWFDPPRGCSQNKEGYDMRDLRPYQFVAQVSTFAPIHHSRPFVPPFHWNRRAKSSFSLLV